MNTFVCAYAAILPLFYVIMLYFSLATVIAKINIVTGSFKPNR